MFIVQFSYKVYHHLLDQSQKQTGCIYPWFYDNYYYAVLDVGYLYQSYSKEHVVQQILTINFLLYKTNSNALLTINILNLIQLYTLVVYIIDDLHYFFHLSCSA